MNTPSPTPAGWRADPHGTPDLLRWWDGVRWTEHTHSGARPTIPAPRSAGPGERGGGRPGAGLGRYGDAAGEPAPAPELGRRRPPPGPLPVRLLALVVALVVVLAIALLLALALAACGAVPRSDG